MSSAISRIITLVCLMACVAYAQLDRGALTGTVTDPTAAVIPNVKITARNTATNAVYETTSNAVGQYTMPNLPVGRYEITFEAPGFKKLVRGGISVGVTEMARVDVALEIGSTSESVQVTAEVPRLQSDTPLVGTALTNTELTTLPVSWGSEGRVVEYFAYKIMPGMVGDPWTSHINGSTSFSKETLLDGVTVTTYLSGHFEEGSVSAEALQEFKVQTSGMQAEFGRSQAGVYNYVMKSGTNNYHGSVYGSLRNEALNANTFANNARGLRRQPERKLDYAFSFGGPVTVPKVYHGRDKTFFYTAYERYKERTGGLGSPTITLPIPDFLQGDFSRLLGADTGQRDALGRPVLRGAIYDPLTFRQVGGVWVGDSFPGNKILPARFSQVSQRLNSILGKYYTPVLKGADGLIPLVNNAAPPSSQQPVFDYYMFSTKVDQMISDKHRISGSYSYAARPRELINLSRVWDQSQTAAGMSGGPLAQSRFQRVKTDLARLADDYTISPRVLNFFSVYYNRQENPSRGTSVNTDGAKELGIKGLSTFGYPTMDWTAGPFVPLSIAGYTANNFIANVGYGLLETVSFSSGRHFMKAGFDYRRNHLNERPTQGGGFVFSPLGTSIPNASFAGTQTGYAFASYLLGIVHSASLSDPIGAGDRRRYIGAFFQDDFKVSQKLTLNLGLRWEYQPPVTEVADRLSSWNPNKTDPLSGLRGAYDFAGNCQVCTGQSSFGHRSLRDWGPRVGFAWQPLPRWVMRGAYGIFYEGNLSDGFSGTPLYKPTQVAWGGTWPLSADAVTPWAGIFNWDNGFPTSRYQAAAFDLSWGDKNRPGMIEPDYGRTGYIQQWNLSIQREVLRNLVVEIGYVGNKATGLRNGDLARPNQLPPAVLAQFGTRLNNAVRSAADAAANGIPYPYPGFSGTVAGALRAYPQVQGNQTVQVYGSPLGFSTYNALQIVVNRQFARGLSVYANYVWSKNLTNTSSSMAQAQGGSNLGPLDYYNLKLEKAPSQYDVPHMFKAYASYELPLGHGKSFLANTNRVVNTIVGGWTVASVLNYFSGVPLFFSANSPLASGWNGALNRPNVAAGNLMAGFSRSNFNFANTQSAQDTYLNKTLFSQPAALTLGTGAPSYTGARGFGTINEDFSLQKNTQLTEKLRFQLRVDFLNAFNRHTFGGINANVSNLAFGQVTSVSGNRQVQIGARLDF